MFHLLLELSGKTIPKPSMFARTTVNPTMYIQICDEHFYILAIKRCNPHLGILGYLKLKTHFQVNRVNRSVMTIMVSRALRCLRFRGQARAIDIGQLIHDQDGHEKAGFRLVLDVLAPSKWYS